MSAVSHARSKRNFGNDGRNSCSMIAGVARFGGLWKRTSTLFNVDRSLRLIKSFPRVSNFAEELKVQRNIVEWNESSVQSGISSNRSVLQFHKTIVEGWLIRGIFRPLSSWKNFWEMLRWITIGRRIYKGNFSLYELFERSSRIIWITIWNNKLQWMTV